MKIVQGKMVFVEHNMLSEISYRPLGFYFLDQRQDGWFWSSFEKWIGTLLLLSLTFYSELKCKYYFLKYLNNENKAK